MNRLPLAALLLSCCALLGAATFEPNPPRKPILYIVHAGWCAPCKTFESVWCDNRDVREALQAGYDVRSLDWDHPVQGAQARSMGVKSVPTFLAFRNGVPMAKHEGFTMSGAEIDAAVADLMKDLHVEWPRAKPAPRVNRAPAETQREPPIVRAPDPPRVNAGPTVDSEARDGIARLASESRELQQQQKQTQDVVQGLQSEVAEVRSQVEGVRSQVTESRQVLSSQLKESHESTRSELSTITERLKESIERTILVPAAEKPAAASIPLPQDIRPSGPDISAEIKTGPTTSKWLAVLAWAGKTGLAIAAPEIALPGSALLTAAGFALQAIRRRRAARQPAPLGHPTNPIMVSDVGPKTETKFVVSETDVLGEAYAESIRRVGNIHRESQPYVVDLLKQVDSVAQQLAHGRRVSRRPASEPTSETQS